MPFAVPTPWLGRHPKPWANERLLGCSALLFGPGHWVTHQSVTLSRGACPSVPFPVPVHPVQEEEGRNEKCVGRPQQDKHQHQQQHQQQQSVSAPSQTSGGSPAPVTPAQLVPQATGGSLASGAGLGQGQTQGQAAAAQLPAN